MSNRIFSYLMTVQETNLRKKCWVMSFRDPGDVNADIISSHDTIGMCDMFPVFPCIRLILNNSSRWNPEKNYKWSTFFPYGWVNTALGAVQLQSMAGVYLYWCQQWLGTVNSGSQSFSLLHYIMCVESLGAERGAGTNHNTKWRSEFCVTVTSSYDVNLIVIWDAKSISKSD